MRRSPAWTRRKRIRQPSPNLGRLLSKDGTRPEGFGYLGNENSRPRWGELRYVGEYLIDELRRVDDVARPPDPPVVSCCRM